MSTTACCGWGSNTGIRDIRTQCQAKRAVAERHRQGNRDATACFLHQAIESSETRNPSKHTRRGPRFSQSHERHRRPRAEGFHKASWAVRFHRVCRTGGHREFPGRVLMRAAESTNGSGSRAARRARDRSPCVRHAAVAGPPGRRSERARAPAAEAPATYPTRRRDGREEGLLQWRFPSLQHLFRQHSSHRFTQECFRHEPGDGRHCQEEFHEPHVDERITNLYGNASRAWIRRFEIPCPRRGHEATVRLRPYSVRFRHVCRSDLLEASPQIGPIDELSVQPRGVGKPIVSGSPPFLQPVADADGGPNAVDGEGSYDVRCELEPSHLPTRSTRSDRQKTSSPPSPHSSTRPWAATSFNC